MVEIQDMINFTFLVHVSVLKNHNAMQINYSINKISH